MYRNWGRCLAVWNPHHHPNFHNNDLRICNIAVGFVSEMGTHFIVQLMGFLISRIYECFGLQCWKWKSRM
jgi:hypothetical protein